MPIPPNSDESYGRLVRRAQAGDRSAESALLAALEPIVRAYFLKRVGRHVHLDDLIQNTLLRVFRGMSDIQDGTRVRGFTMKAALFELQDLFRGRYDTRESSILADLPEPAVGPERTGLSIDLDRAMAVLTPRAREIMELKALGYKYEEIAGMVDTTEAAVKMQVKRAVEKLRDILAVALVLIFPPAVLLLFAELLRLIS